MPQAEMLFSRYKDGAKPVRVLQDGWEVLTIDGVPEGPKHTTVKSLLVALTGHPEGRHWSLDRYFRMGRHDAPPTKADADIFDLWPPGQPPPLLITSPEISIPVEKGEKAIRKKNLTRESGPTVILGSRLGIDLAKRGHEVRKLLFAGFGRRIFQAGYDPEDVLQEVYKGLLVRNQGKCPWDPAKSSFGHYVHLVCSCVLSNFHRKQNRIREMEQLGLPNPHGGDEEAMRYTDVASNVTVPAPITHVAEEASLLEEAEDLAEFMRTQEGTTESRLAARMLPHLLQGSSREDMASALGTTNMALSRASATLRTQAQHWLRTLR
jgi:DNA-directed RNA polymerase specialized sigma24 family protein